MEKLSNAKKKWIRSLHHKKYREKYGYFIGEGDKLFNELSKKQKVRLHALIATEDWWTENQVVKSILIDSDLYTTSVKDIEQISINKTPQPPIMVFEFPQETVKYPEIEQDLLLYLDGIRDPGNLGTIIRLADWFGHTTILVSNDTVDWKNPKVIQSSMGSFLRVNVIVTDLREYIAKSSSERKIIGASMKGDALDKSDIHNSILVIGNESQGIRDNTAIAAAIFCYQSFIK